MVSAITLQEKSPFSTISNLFNSNSLSSTSPPHPGSPDSFQTGLPEREREREIQKCWAQGRTEEDGGEYSAVKSLKVVIGIT